MKTSAVILTFLLLTISSIGFCQDYKKEIETQFISYNSLIIKKDFEKSMDFIPEELFEIVSKEQMINAMERIFNNPEMEFELEKPIIIEISDVQNIDNKFYSRIQYSSLMKMKLKSTHDEEKTEAEHKQRMNLIKASFQQAYGPDNVKYDEKAEVFDIKVEKQAYAMSTGGKADWKFLVVEKKQKVILDKLLPKQLVDNI